MAETIQYSSITHAHISPLYHPRLNAEINGRSAVKYLRFLREVEVERLVLPLSVYGRWVPYVPVHPARLKIATFDPEGGRWNAVKTVEFEPNPRIAGEGLHQGLSEDEMNAYFRQVLAETPPYEVNLGGLRTTMLRVECDREHPVWPNHGENNGNCFHVPFGILDPLQVYGQALAAEMPLPEIVPILRQGRVEPGGARGLSWRRHGETIRFESRYLSVGFSLRRPIMMHLGWDALGQGQAGRSRVAARRVRFDEHLRGMCGPLLVTPQGDYGSHRWSGEVEIIGNRVSYRDLHCVPGLSLDVSFTIEPRRIWVELAQRAEREIAALEAETWRLVFDLGRGMTGVAGIPTLKPGRSGDVRLPALLAGDGVGCLGIEAASGTLRLQVESYRNSNEVSAGLALGEAPAADALVRIAPGEARAELELRVDNLQPVTTRGAGRAGEGVRRHWASGFSCYRPEWGGFSNHAASVNCHVNQHGQIELAAFTRKTRSGFDPLEMARFTIARALMDGSGYGYWRNLYLDSDPVLVAAAGRIYQARADLNWLRAVEPGLVEAVERMLATIGEEGLSICRDLTGNSGTYRWSSNAWDIVGFGHMDAYVNAWTYRALRNAEALLWALGRREQAGQARAAADGIRANYARWLVNPATGWVAGWRSRDGQLHDYAYVWINGIACAFGVLESETARTALANLEALRDRLGITSARLGLPFNLLPLRLEDHMMPRIMNFKYTEPTFEMYTDGSMSPLAATYYLRALSIHGFKERARAIAADLDAGFADGLFTGGAYGGVGSSFGRGNEFLSWEGLLAGYEGTFGPAMGALYGVAIEQGVFQPPEPEWWPRIEAD